MWNIFLTLSYNSSVFTLCLNISQDPTLVRCSDCLTAVLNGAKDQGKLLTGSSLLPSVGMHKELSSSGAR